MFLKCFENASEVYIEVQNRVKYGGQMDFFSSRCFRKLLNSEDQKWFWQKLWHWINLSADTEFFSPLKFLTKIWPFKRHF